MSIYNLQLPILGHDIYSNNIPDGTIAFNGLSMTLMIIFSVMYLGSTIYKSRSIHIIEQILPEFFNIYFFIPLIVLALIVTNCVLSLLPPVWTKVSFLSVHIAQIIIPGYAIFRKENVKSYVLRLLQDELHDAFLLSIYLIPTFLFFCINGTLYLIYDYIEIQIVMFIAKS